MFVLTSSEVVISFETKLGIQRVQYKAGWLQLAENHPTSNLVLLCFYVELSLTRILILHVTSPTVLPSSGNIRFRIRTLTGDSRAGAHQGIRYGMLTQAECSTRRIYLGWQVGRSNWQFLLQPAIRFAQVYYGRLMASLGYCPTITSLNVVISINRIPHSTHPARWSCQTARNSSASLQLRCKVGLVGTARNNDILVRLRIVDGELLVARMLDQKRRLIELQPIR